MLERKGGGWLSMAAMAGLLCLGGVGCQVSVSWMPDKKKPGIQAAQKTPPTTVPDTVKVPETGQNQTIPPELIQTGGFQPGGTGDSVIPLSPPDPSNGTNKVSGSDPKKPGANPKEMPEQLPYATEVHSVPTLPGPVVCPIPNNGYPPSEKSMVIHPPYRVAPPDILFLNAVRLVPKPPYRLQPLDVVIIRASRERPEQPLTGQYTITPEGYVSFGFAYGAVKIVGLTLKDAQERLQKALTDKVGGGTQISIDLASFTGVQQIQGEHLVRPDGTVSLGSYGAVNVTGLTLAQIKYAVEGHLSQWIQDPSITVDVFAYNSKSYYVIADGGGFGQQITRFPITGNETVLDAIERIGGLPSVSSRRRIWVARPGPVGSKNIQVLPVDWKAIVMNGATETNFQLFPGDRVYIAADRFIAFDNVLQKIISPIERILGVTLLGASTVRSLGPNNGGGNSGFLIGF